MPINNTQFWNHIAASISNASNRDFHIGTKNTVHGGCINQTFLLTDNHLGYFVKINQVSSLDNFHCEITGLTTIDNTNTIRVPKVICAGSFENYSFLVLESIQLMNRGLIDNFALALADLHKKQNSQFGFSENNYIGATKQINSPMPDWIEFFLQNRIGYQLDLLESKYDIRPLRKLENELRIRIGDLFKNHTPAASLLHGDLWQGNYSFDEQGAPVIYDPACYYGDHEADLAMLELFGNPGRRFFDVYRQHYPIDQGYQQRKMLYNLYHILNHANLFGTSYLGQAKEMMGRLSRPMFFEKQ